MMPENKMYSFEQLKLLIDYAIRECSMGEDCDGYHYTEEGEIEDFLSRFEKNYSDCVDDRIVGIKDGIMYIVYDTSDYNYSVCGVFTTKDLAQTFIDSCELTSDHSYHIDEFVVNPFKNEIKNGCSPYFTISYANFEVKTVKKEDSLFSFSRDKNYGFNYDNVRKEYFMWMNLFALNDENAIGITREVISEILKDDKWGINP